MSDGIIKKLASFLESAKCATTNGTYDWDLQSCNPKEEVDKCKENGKIFSPDADPGFFPDQCMTEEQYSHHLENFSLSRETRVCEKEGDVMIGRRCVSREERRCLQSQDKVWMNDTCQDRMQETVDWNGLF